MSLVHSFLEGMYMHLYLYSPLPVYALNSHQNERLEQCVLGGVTDPPGE
jgi:hypothetical protein